MENLRIYKTALELVVETYQLTKDNSLLAKDFSLSDQLKRASVSVVANIAEGYLTTRKQFKHYLSISSGSTNEMVALLQVVSAVYEINTAELQEKYRVLGKQINAFSKNIKK